MEYYNTPQRDYVPLLPEDYVLAYKTDDLKLHILDLREFITTQRVDNECRLEAATIEQLKISFSYNADDALVRVPPVDGESQWYVPAVLIPRLLRFCHYASMVGHLG